MMSIKLAVAISATVAFLIELCERGLEKYVQKKKPRLTPPGYMRDEHTIRKEQAAVENWKPVEKRLDRVEHVLKIVKYFAGVAAVILAWIDLTE